jgi:hypothetical protein
MTSVKPLIHQNNANLAIDTISAKDMVVWIDHTMTFAFPQEAIWGLSAPIYCSPRAFIFPVLFINALLYEYT